MAGRARPQPLYNLLSRRIEDECAAFSERYAMHNVVDNPLASSLLSGKHTDPVRPEPGGRFAAVEALRQVAEGIGLTLVELAFR